MTFISIPTYNSKTRKYSYTDFATRDEWKKFVWSKFKPPGELKLHDTWAWRLQASRFDEEDMYDKGLVFRSKDYVEYWDFEKEKCRKGLIVDEFYLSRYYYFWINFLPINDKEVNKLKFPKIWDSQYYFSLYVTLCELEYKYSVVVKKRQWGSTFQHLAILLNDVWFEEGFINKVAAFDDEYLKADWPILEEYRNFLNTHTGWRRMFSPDKIFNWQQKWKVKQAGKTVDVGNKSVLKGINLKMQCDKGVGGKNNKFYYEEAGISKTLSCTFGYIDPALKLGAITTGMFMAGGSVGELDKCEDLKRMARDPGGFNVLSVKNKFEEAPDVDDICFFVPEYWSMPPYIDGDGNSMIEEAKAWCYSERLNLKLAYSPEIYRMYISQHPFDLGEAFAWRKDSIFPLAKIIKQQERIKADKKRLGTPVKLDRSENGGIKHTIIDFEPINKFPLGDKDMKEGCVVVWEWPDPDAPFFTYFAGVDPVATDKTTTSPSLFSIYIFKNLTEEVYVEKDVQKLKLSGYKPVASYVGRYDDLKRTNEIAEMLILWYQALAAVENNVPSFINHMQQKGLQRYLASKEQLAFISELKTNKDVYSAYGFKMNNTIRTYFIDIVNEYLNEELDVVYKHNSEEVVKRIWGTERVDDYGLLEELKLYHDKLNVDRFVAFAAGLALMKAFRKYGLGVSRIDKTIKKDPDYTVRDERGFFKHMGEIIYTKEAEEQSPERSYFKNYR